MFAEMNSANLYPPQYRQSTDAAVEHVTLTLLNLERPSAWDEVSDWIDRNGPIGNSKLREIANIDTLEASRMLKQWVERGLLAAVPDRGRRNAAYIKPTQTLSEAGLFSFSEGFANNNRDLKNTQ